MDPQTVTAAIGPRVTEIVRRLLSALVSSALGLKLGAWLGIDPDYALALAVPLGAAASGGLSKLFDWGYHKVSSWIWLGAVAVLVIGLAAPAQARDANTPKTLRDEDEMRASQLNDEAGRPYNASRPVPVQDALSAGEANLLRADIAALRIDVAALLQEANDTRIRLLELKSAVGGLHAQLVDPNGVAIDANSRGLLGSAVANTANVATRSDANLIEAANNAVRLRVLAMEAELRDPNYERLPATATLNVTSADPNLNVLLTAQPADPNAAATYYWIRPAQIVTGAQATLHRLTSGTTALSPWLDFGANGGANGRYWLRCDANKPVLVDPNGIASQAAVVIEYLRVP